MGIFWDSEVVEHKQVTLREPPGGLDLALKNTSDMLSQWELRGYSQWSVIEKVTGRLIGCVGFTIRRDNGPVSISRLGRSALPMGQRLCDRGGDSRAGMGLGIHSDRPYRQPHRHPMMITGRRGSTEGINRLKIARQRARVSVRPSDRAARLSAWSKLEKRVSRAPAPRATSANAARCTLS